MQNCPKRRSDATRRPFASTVTCVPLFWSADCTLAYFRAGISANGCVSGGSGVTICCEGTFTVLAPSMLALPLVAAASSPIIEVLVVVVFLSAVVPLLLLVAKQRLDHLERDTQYKTIRSEAEHE